MDPLSNKYINWSDGMKISQKHLHELQNIVEEKSRDSIATQAPKDGFGILPAGHEGKKPLDYMLRLEGENALSLELRQCRAITPSGNRVELLTGSAHEGKNVLKGRLELEKAGLVNSSSLFVALRYMSGEMEPFGLPDSNESPPRLPYTSPRLQLELMPGDADPKLYHHCVIVARMSVQNGVMSHDESYIPPSLAMSGHDALKEFAFKYIQFLQELENNAFAVVRNIARKDTLTPLAESVNTYVREVIASIQHHFDFLEMFGERLHPAHFLLNAKQLARGMKNSIEMLRSDSKEELLNYFQDVIELGPAEYMGVNAAVHNAQYSHYNIRKSLEAILEFCKVNGKLMTELSHLDYIGKKKKTGIFVGEVTRDEETPKPKKRWDF